MIWSTVWVEAVVFTALFTALVMIPTIKHPEIGVHSYPPDIQEEYFKTYEHAPVAPLSGRTIAFKGFGTAPFTVLLTYRGHPCRGGQLLDGRGIRGHPLF